MKTLLIVVTTIIAFALPIAMAVIWKKETKVRLLPFLVGALCFLLFANYLEATVHILVLANDSLANAIYGNPLIYILYASIMAGLFEETGRLFAYKVLLKKYKRKENSVAYGIGHGGVECILVLGSTYLMYSIVLLGGSLGDPQTDAQLLTTVASIEPLIIPAALIERIMAMCLHIGLSILMFKACREKKSFYYYPLSILIHAIADIPAGLYQAGVINSIVVIELMVAVISIGVLYYAINVYRKMDEDNKEDLTNARI